MPSTSQTSSAIIHVWLWRRTASSYIGLRLVEQQTSNSVSPMGIRRPRQATRYIERSRSVARWLHYPFFLQRCNNACQLFDGGVRGETRTAFETSLEYHRRLFGFRVGDRRIREHGFRLLPSLGGNRGRVFQRACLTRLFCFVTLFHNVLRSVLPSASSLHFPRRD